MPYQAHRYETFKNGVRTWRMDTVKGSSCVMLTTEEDWKKPETSHQSCICEDSYNETPAPSLDILKALKCL